VGHADRDRGWLAALRGDIAAAETMLAGLQDLRASEDPQDKAAASILEAFTAAARHQSQDTLRHARDTLAYADALGISSEFLRWAWPLAARTAHDLADTTATDELLAMLDPCEPGHLTRMQWAERDLARVRRSARDGDQGAAVSFAAVVTSLREQSTPYHLAHGLLDHADYLMRQGDDGAAAAASEEARGIASRLRCRPLLDRAADLAPAEPRVRA
jgi:hypothetical protein